ncbi:MAG: redoxin domain-containing protein [Deltaproteobacteria bacterium]|nr:redoxin domain-containing protein [Deltaproteobacteria bacterium]
MCPRAHALPLFLAPFLALPALPAAAAHAAVGTDIPQQQLPRLGGGTGKLLGDTAASVVLFFRPDHANSRATLKDMAVCEKEFQGKPVHWVGVVSDKASKAATQQDVKEAGLRMPILVDKGDALYGTLGVALHPVVLVVDRKHKLAAFQTFSKLNFCAIVRAHVRHQLGEITKAELDAELNPAPASQRSDVALARRHLGLARNLFRIKKYDKALAEVKISIAKDATHAPAHTLLGQIHAAKGDCAAARPAFAQALKLDPKDAEAAAGVKQCGGK